MVLSLNHASDCSYVALRILGVGADHPTCLNMRNWVSLPRFACGPPLNSRPFAVAQPFRRMNEALTAMLKAPST